MIAIQVHRFSDGNYLECQDFWRISGIERDIYMYAQPQIHLTDFKAETPLDADYRNGILKVKVKFANETGKEIPFTVGYRLRNSKDEQIAQSSARASYGQTYTCHQPEAHQRRRYRSHQLQSGLPHRRDKGQAADGERQTDPCERRQLP